MEQHHWTMKIQVIMTYMYYGGQRSHHTDSLSGNQQSDRLQDDSKITEVKNVGHVDLHIVQSQWLIIQKYYFHPSNSLQDTRKNSLAHEM